MLGLPHTSLLLPCALVLAPSAAAARPEPATLFGQPVNRPPEPTAEELAARRAAFERALKDRDLLEIGDMVVPRALVEGDLTAAPRERRAWDQPPHRQTIFLNFFGGKLSDGNVAAEMQASCLMVKELDYPGFKGSEQDALTIVQMFEHAVEPFGIRVAYEAAPPRHLPYSMVMLGGSPELLGKMSGVVSSICNRDCGDQWWRDTSFVYTEASNSIHLLGNAAVQAAARAWGLDFVHGDENIMFPMIETGTRVWTDTCTETYPEFGPIGCASVHDQFCGPDSGAQNDVAELTAFFGPNSVDDVPPTVTLLSPQDGAVLEPGDDLLIEVEVTDNFEGVGWRLMVPELGQEEPAHYGQKKWTFPAPKGAYTIRVEAIDHDRNIGFAEARIYVGVEPEPETTGDPTTGDGTGDSTGDSTGGGDTVDAATAGIDPPGDDGCDCASSPASKDMPPWALALLTLGLLRRRR